ncbi:hypothetical protein RSOL_513730 [Rhizoctonia solani AG-3 Rhs1AP]|uniref:Uncharacterized protein n=1 Tax=Rhizoctonia solani AG-3 Rhs1AP TaxID=1086054 RepID=X8JMU6_9AGAM|nr:hypothetical protein RSOL_513730 [Rhizoctonia solani AG-3 Rhs1AP]
MGRGYGYLIPYPDVPAEQVHEIYQQSLRRIVYGYGFFVDPFALDSKKVSLGEDESQALKKVKSDLYALGLHPTSIASHYPTPMWLRDTGEEEGWLVILGTGFDLKHHVPISSEMVKHAQAILSTDEEPSWWPMMEFCYPSPKSWLADKEKHMQQATK